MLGRAAHPVTLLIRINLQERVALDKVEGFVKR